MKHCVPIRWRFIRSGQTLGRFPLPVLRKVSGSVYIEIRKRYVLWNIRVRPGMLPHGRCAVPSYNERENWNDFLFKSWAFISIILVLLLASLVWVNCFRHCKSPESALRVFHSVICSHQRTGSGPALSRVLARGALSVCVLGLCRRQECVFSQFLSGIGSLFSLSSLARIVSLPPWDMHTPMRYSEVSPPQPPSFGCAGVRENAKKKKKKKSGNLEHASLERKCCWNFYSYR